VRRNGNPLHEGGLMNRIIRIVMVFFAGMALWFMQHAPSVLR
jgi:hypothetical protein